MKLLSVAVPSYNMEKLLPQCLSSMADAQFSDALEVLVVDDGSTDGTLEIAREYAAKWPEIFTVIHQENGGHGSAVNAALKRANGKYFRIVDADDWLNINRLARLLAEMEKTDADLVLDEKTEVDMTSGEERYFAFPEEMPSGKAVPFEEIAAPRFRYHLALHTVSVKRELLLKHRVWLLEHTFYVDSQFILMATAFARSALVLRMGMYYYRVGNAGQSVYYLGYVKRYAEHDRVLAACLDFYRKREYDVSRTAYVAHSVALLTHTQYNIALIYHPDKPSGRKLARELRARLWSEYPDVAKATDRRYWTALLLNRLGVGYEQLRKLRRLSGKA